MAKRHYIGMAGLHGCMPQTCDVYESQCAAAEGLAEIHGLGRNRRRELARDGYLELTLHRDENEYCEIVKCDCDEPEQHSDSMN